jgi:excisionase family DNA binding protein
MIKKVIEIQNLTINDLTKIIEDSQQKLISEMFEKSQKSGNDEFITRKAAAQILGISIPTLSKYIREGLIPAAHINGRYRLRKADVINSLTEVKHKLYTRNYE